ncbi:MAG: S-layer homology domain-containing protein [Eubacteriales bacterium]|nr:S-layer homology domain-containing protein [Eubacteriales bacterium]
MEIRQRKKLSKIITVPISLAVALTGISAFAATTQTGNFEITSSGSISAKSGEEITIDVYYPDKTYTDLLNADIGDYTKILLRRDQTTVGESGKYEFKFKVGDIPTGEYMVRISRTNVKSEKGVIVEKFVYSNPNDYKTAVEALNKAADVTELKNIIDTYSTALGIDLSNEADSDAILTVMLNSIKAEKLKSDDAMSAKNCFNLSKLVAELNSNKITNINDNISMLDLSKCGLDSYYTKSYVTENVQKNLTNRVSGKNFETVQKLYSILGEQFVLAVIEKSGSNDAIKEVINGFSDKIGASASGLSERNLSELSGKIYSSFSALKSAMDNLKQSGSGSSSSGGGKGGSGGTIGGTKGYSTVPNKDKDDIKNEQLNYYVFDDLDSVSWARDAICKLAEMDVLRGKEYKLFYPNDNITREEFVKMLAVAYKLDSENRTAKFADVNADDWFMPYVAAAFESGIVKGVSDDMFGTGQNITRQDLAVMAYNAALKAEVKFSDDNVQKFSDDGEISDYAKAAVYALKSQDVINGIDGKNFAPQDTATRAEAAKILYSLISLSE